MNSKKYNELLQKLNITLNADGSIPSVSPALGASDEAGLHQRFYITPDIDVESLSKNELLLAHTLLHQLYATGSKSLTKEQIKEIHEKVKPLISHSNFDSLDY